jgi:hypothetical protein
MIPDCSKVVFKTIAAHFPLTVGFASTEAADSSMTLL